MKLNLIENFLLLSLDPQKGKSLIDSLSLNYGIAGAILLELSQNNKLTVKDKRLIVLDKNLTNDFVFDFCLKLIMNSKKNRRVKYWINSLGNKSNVLKKNVLNELVHKRILNKKVKVLFWGLIKINRYPVVDIKLIKELKDNLKSIVFGNNKADVESVLLLSLLHSSKLSRILFSNRKEFRKSNKRIKELTKDIEISGAMGDALKEVQAAVMIATTSAFVGSSAAIS
jgi:hypothetical protein